MKKICFIVSVILIIALCGCTGYREIDRGYLVTAIGFSKTDDKVDILIEAMSSSDVLDKKNERVVLTGSGDDEKSAYINLKTSLVKPLYFEQLGAVVFEDMETFNAELLNEIPNLNFGIYIVRTDDIKNLFENDAPSGILGYDIVGLIKNYNKESDDKILSQFYKVRQNGELPVVNFIDGRLVVENRGE